jgi:sugar-specific transcriptional regulator TrmB
MKYLIQKFGVNAKEAETFLKLLELGPQPAGVLAQKIKVPRSSTYLILQNLEAKQLVESFKKGKITHFKCIPISRLNNLLETRQRDLTQTKNLLEAHIPRLLEIENNLGISCSVKNFQGKEAVTEIYENVLKEEGFYTFFNAEAVAQTMPTYYKDVANMIKKSGKPVKELLINNPEAFKYQKEHQSKNHQIKILPKTADISTDNLFCKNKIYMIAYSKNDVSAVEIHSPILAQSQKTMFALLWDAY